MLYKRLARRALAFHITANVRSFASASFASTMAKAPQSFILDRNIFNESLYSRMRNFWFEGLPEGASTPGPDLLERWYGVNVTPERKAKMDEQCSKEFGHALDALTPDKLALPEFESYEKDIETADVIAGPFLTEVKEAQTKDEKKGAETLLSLVLILDQITRNIYRDSEGLRLVFRHFDRLAFALVQGSMKLTPNPVEYEGYQLRPVIKQWFLMPLEHSEHVPSHELFVQIWSALRKNVEAAGDQPAVDNIDYSMEFEKAHIEPLRKFGRYPHRNAALGRKSTKEEEEELKSGASTFGVHQGQKEKPEWEKSEL
jgi:uncharacterized protein (DUF924 family)